MPDFKILNVFEHDSHMVVLAEHYQSDDSFWFTENYIFQGREGLRHKRQTNELGKILMDNGEPAPENPAISPVDLPQQYLPDGRTWLRHSTPRITTDGVLSKIRETHRLRVISGWPVQSDALPPLSANEADRNGCASLFEHLKSLNGHEE